MKKSLLSSVLCGAAVLSAAVVFSSCGRAQINASDYVTIKFDGYDNYGTATARFDYVQMMRDNKEGFGLDKGSEADEIRVEAQIEESIDGKLDKNSDLKNGDTVTYSWKNSGIETLEKNYKVKFTFEDKTATVEGLEEAQDFDPFEDISLDFTGYDGSGVIQQANFNVDGVAIEVNVTKNGKFSNGDTVKAKIKGDIKNIKTTMLQQGKNITQTEKEFTVEGLEPIKEVDLFDYLTVNFTETSPNGKVSVQQKAGAPVNYINYNISKTDGLSNGDVVKITIEGDYSQEGVKAASSEKEYTVEGLTAYISQLSEIPGDMLTKMQKQSEDAIEAQCSSWDEKNVLAGKKNIGYYFVKPKEGFSANFHNELYLVYKNTASLYSVTDKEKKNDTRKQHSIDYYTYVKFSELMILPDGTWSVDLSKYQICTDSFKSNLGYYSWGYFEAYSLKGYADLDSMFNRIITPKIGNCEYENTVSDKAEEEEKAETKEKDKEKKSDKKKDE